MECHVCDKSFKYTKNLHNHLDKVHGIIRENEEIKCDQCGILFKYKKNLLRHLTKFHPVTSGCSVKEKTAEIATRPEKCDLSRMLPEGFNHKIITLKPFLQNSMWFIGKIKFPATRETLQAWKEKFEAKNQLSLRTVFQRNSSETYYVRYRCHHNTCPKKTSTPSKKHTSCTASVTFNLRCNDGVSTADVFIKNTHNHIINGASALKFRRPSKEIKEKFVLMYESKRSVSQALQLHKSDLEALYGDELYLALADRGIMPDPYWAYALYYKLFKNMHGASHGEEMLVSLQKVVDNYNLSAGNKCSELQIFPDGNFALALATPLMKRVAATQDAAEIVFMDASSSVDRYGCTVFLLMVNSKAGGLPIGTLITTSENAAIIKTALQLHKGLMNDTSYGGRGAHGPKLIMTDDSTAERNALSCVFPETTLLLCIFHILQAAWRYLWNKNSCVPLEERQGIFSTIKEMVYANNVKELENTYLRFLSSPQAAQFDKAQNYIMNLYSRRHEWSICIRKELITRGHNTNNLCEAAVRVLKDRVLERMRAFSPVQLFSFISKELSSHYEMKLLETAAGRESPHLSRKFHKLSKRDLDFTVTKVNDNLYVITNNVNNNSYVINTDISVCSCFIGCNGALCKHQYYLSIQVNYNPPSMLPCNEAEKINLHYLAVGKSNIETNWYSQLLLDGSNSNSQPTLEGTLSIEPNENREIFENNANINAPSNFQEINERNDITLNKFMEVCEEIKQRCKNSPDTLMPGVEAFLKSYESNARTDTALLTSLHTFGKYQGVLQTKKRNSRNIGVQPTAISRRKSSLSTRRCITNGRPPKWSRRPEHNYSKQNTKATLSVGTSNAAPHNLSYCVEKNISLGKKH